MSAVDVDTVRRLLSRLMAGTQRGDLLWQPAENSEYFFTLHQPDGSYAVIWSEDEDGGYPIRIRLFDSSDVMRAQIGAELGEDRPWDNDLWELLQIVQAKSSPVIEFLNGFAAEVESEPSADDHLFDF